MVLDLKNRERITAKLMAAETLSVEKLGVRAVARAIAKAKSQFKRLLRNGVTPFGAITQILLEEADELAEAMLASHLIGRKRSMLNATIAMSASSRAVEALKNLFSMPDDLIEEYRSAYKADIRGVLHRLGTNADDKVQEAVLEAITREEHIGTAMKRIDEAFRRSGVSPDKSHSIENIFRTQCQTAYSAGRWHQDNDILTEMLWGYKYLTVGDDRVRPNHAALDGVVLPKDDPRWNVIYPPNGYMCRCQVFELYDEEDIVEPPAEGIPDEGFAFNPGRIY